MGFAYLLSLCSTSDAFVASSFIGIFSKGSLLTFLVIGPMLDFKSTLMLFSAFKSKFVLLFSFLIAVVVLTGSICIDYLFFS
ncbi:permease [Paenibacillus hexagrammi]|nr:permease [Paenibacillus sp. YPD9-1]